MREKKPRAFPALNYSVAQKAHRGRLPPGASREGPAARPAAVLGALAPAHCGRGWRTERPPARLQFRGPGGLCSPSGVPPRDRVWRVPRKAGLKMQAPRGSRSPEPECPDPRAARDRPPRPSSARRREALPRRRFARAPQGALAAGQGGAWRGAHVVPPVLPSGPQRLHTRASVPNRSPRGKAARRARPSRAGSGWEPRTGAEWRLGGARGQGSHVPGPGAEAPSCARPPARSSPTRQMAPAPHVAGGALRSVYILRPLHVVLLSFAAIGRLLGRGFAPPGGAGPQAPAPRAGEDLGVPPAPRPGLGWTTLSLPKCRTEPQPDTPRSRS